MFTAENAKIQYESGQDLIAFAALTDQGSHKDYLKTGNPCTLNSHARASWRT